MKSRPILVGGVTLVSKLWLHPLDKPTSRKQQSISARNLLRIACEIEEITLTEHELRLTGLELITLFKEREQQSLSIAHCSSMLAIALAPGEVGVDCEGFGRTRKWPEIARQFFAPGEAKKIESAKAEEIESLFIRHWVLKEAYIKAVQGSIFGDLNRLVIDEKNNVSIEENGFQDSWSAWEMRLCNTLVAVCDSGSSSIQVFVVKSMSHTLADCSIEHLPEHIKPNKSAISVRQLGQ